MKITFAPEIEKVRVKARLYERNRLIAEAETWSMVHEDGKFRPLEDVRFTIKQNACRPDRAVIGDSQFELRDSPRLDRYDVYLLQWAVEVTEIEAVSPVVFAGSEWKPDR